MAVRDVDTLKSLKIRTYDKTSTDVMAKVASAASIGIGASSMRRARFTIACDFTRSYIRARCTL